MSVIEQMLARYPEPARDQALRAVMQEIALASLLRGGFFDKAFEGEACAFFTAFPGSPKTLISAWSRTLTQMPDEFAAFGFEVAIIARQNSTDSAIVSAFVKKGTSIFGV